MARMSFNPIRPTRHPAVRQAGEPRSVIGNAARTDTKDAGDAHPGTGDLFQSDEGGGAVRRTAIEVTGAAKEALVNTLIGKG